MNVLIPMQSIISITKLFKTYASGLVALKDINLEIRRGEIFALLGPNGAGKTTLISIVCGIVNASQGAVSVDDSERASQVPIRLEHDRGTDVGTDPVQDEVRSGLHLRHRDADIVQHVQLSAPGRDPEIRNRAVDDKAR